MEKGFEFKPQDKNGAFIAKLMLSPFRADKAMEKCAKKGVQFIPIVFD